MEEYDFFNFFNVTLTLTFKLEISQEYLMKYAGAGTKFLITKFLITKFLTHKVPNNKIPNHKIPK